MAYQATFKRYELKFMLDKHQKARIMAAMQPYMSLDKYGRTTIRNIYFDTDNYQLIRHSIEKPAYKEKLRLRSYRPAGAADPVFVELKKKYNSVVYKRRLSMPQSNALQWLAGEQAAAPQGQIAAEISYFKDLYHGIHPAVLLTYEREAWYSLDKSDFRVTFDDTILCRREDICLEHEPWGTSLLPEGKVLMEIKTSGGIPLWMTHTLTDNHIFKTSFSKYGTAYEKMIFPNLKGGYLHV